VDSVTLGEIVNIASKIGLGSLLIVILYGGARRWWVFGWYYDAKVMECEALQERLDRVAGLTERTVETIETAVRSPRRGSRPP
jgi:hypothetical protein